MYYRNLQYITTYTGPIGKNPKKQM
jgi:hypothetical protein